MQKYKIMNNKTAFLVCLLLTFFNIAAFGQAKDKVSKVVIDAGHGGSMPGAIGKLCKEKDITLKVAKRFGKLISEHFEDVTVIYTRKNDETVDLYKRAEIANKNKADLFISIHCNAAENKSAHGVETFVMGLGKSEENLSIAKKENADMLLEKDYKTNYSNFDPNSPEAYIVFSLYTSAYLNRSTILASKVQSHLVNHTKMTDRTVQQAGFWVLYKVAMPSILIELGFISNTEEEKYLVREDTQELLATCIYNAFVEYKNLTEGTQKPYLPVPKVHKPQHTTEHQNVTEQPNIQETPTDTEIPSSPSVEIQNVKNSETPNSQNIEIIGFQNVESKDTIKIDAHAVSNPTLDDIRFRIQFFMSKEKMSTSDKKFATFPDVKKYNETNVWKYTTGNYQTLAEAQTLLKEIKKQYADAFIIAFRNERKISIQEAQELIK